MFAAPGFGQPGKATSLPAPAGKTPVAAADPKATVSLFAGSEKQKGETDHADPLQARFSGPKRMVWDPWIQALYVADGGSNSTLRKVAANGEVTTVVPWKFLGNYDEIYAMCLAPDKAGAVYFTTKGNRLFKYDPGLPVNLDLTGDRATNPAIVIGRYQRPDSYINKDGNETGSLAEAGLDGALGLAGTPNGKLYFANSYRKTVHKIDFTAATQVQAFAGKPTAGVADPAFAFADAQGLEATFGNPSDLCADAKGNLYVADNGYKTVRKVNPSGTVSSFFQHALTTGLEPVEKDGPLTSASAARVTLIAASADGSLIFFSSFGRLRLLRPGIGITTLAGFNGISGLTATPDGKTVYVASGYAVYKVAVN